MTDYEAQLVARLRAGDAEALPAFLAATRASLLAHVERRLGTALRRKVDPEDIVQETSAEAVRSFAAMSLAQREPFGWLCEIAERKIIDAHRRHFGAQKRDAGREVGLGSPSDQSRQAGIIDLLVASMTTPSQAFSRGERELRLLDAMAQLPDEQREALRLRYVENLPSAEIAQRLGKSSGAVRVMLTRAVSRLQALLGEGGP